MTGHFDWIPHTERVLVRHRVCIAPEALAVLLRHVQANGANEAGGILLGRFIQGGGVAIDEVTTPGLLDVAGPRSFVADGGARNAAILEAWERSGGTLHYLGQWHTHSEPMPVPSRIDWTTWTTDAASIRAQHGEPNLPLVYLIVGQTHLGTWAA